MSIPRKGKLVTSRPVVSSTTVSPLARSWPTQHHRFPVLGSTAKASAGILVDLPEFAAAEVHRGHAMADQLAEIDPSAGRVDRDAMDRPDRLACVEFSEQRRTNTTIGLEENPECVMMRTVFLEVLVAIVEDDDRGGLGRLLVGDVETRYRESRWTCRLRSPWRTAYRPGAPDGWPPSVRPRRRFFARIRPSGPIRNVAGITRTL